MVFLGVIAMAENNSAKAPDHIFTPDELVNKLTDFTGALSKDQKAAIDPSLLSSLEDVSAGITQAYERISTLNQTVANLEKTAEDYKSKIAAYASEQADRMAQSVQQDDKDENAAAAALKIIESEDD